MMKIFDSTIRVLALVIYALSATYAEAQAQRRPWSGGFSIDLPHGPIVFAIGTLQQDETHLIGKFVFENNLGDAGKPRPVVIPGRKSAEGEFWPQAELQVGDERNGKWKTIASSLTAPASGEITVQPGSTVWLKVELDAFQDFIGKYDLGKVILKTGDEEIFPLSDLAPPPEPVFEHQPES